MRTNALGRVARVASLLLAPLLLALPAYAQVSLSPPRTRVAIEPGGHTLERVYVRNGSSRALDAEVLRMDWVVEGDGSSGGLRYGEPGTLPGSCTDRLAVSPERFVLEPGAQQEIQLALSLPVGATGSCHAAIQVVTGPVADGEGAKGVSLTAKMALGHLIVVDAAGASRFSAEVERFEVLPPNDTGPLVFVADLRNTGDATLRLAGEFAVTDEKGALAAKAPSSIAMAFAGRTARVTGELGELLPAGRYAVLGVFDLGGGQVLSPETSFEIVDRLVVAGWSWPTPEAPGVRLTLSNEGHVTHTGSGSVSVLSDGALLQTDRLDGLTVLPGETAEITLPPWRLAPGRYDARVRIETATAAIEQTVPFECSFSGALAPVPAASGRTDPTGAPDDPGTP